MNVCQEQTDYRFEDAPNKVRPSINLKRQNNDTRFVWGLLQEYGLSYYGVIRDWTAVFGHGGTFVVLHHFVDEKPMWALYGKDSDIHYRHLSMGGGLEDLIETIAEAGYRITIPEQAYVDAILHEMTGPYNWHYESPVHKLVLKARGERHSFAIEVFGDDMPFPPYGVKEPLPWPPLKIIDNGIQLDLFDAAPFVVETSVVEPIRGERMGIAGSVNEALERETDEAIARVFRECELVVVPASGGKDSSVIMQKCLRYKQENPDCKTELVIVSADVLTENPLLAAHVHRLKEAVDSMGIGVQFIIVEPAITDTYMVTVFGRGYATPSANFRWCVDRLKVTPGRKALEQFVTEGKRVCQLLGLREPESTARAASIDKHYADEFYGNHVVKGILTAAPIRRWSATDTITYLMRNDVPWKDTYDYGNSHLIHLYGSAMSGGGLEECPIGASILSENEAVRSCTGKAARMGCWSCTIISDDTSLRNQMELHEEIRPLYEMRQYFKAGQDIRYCAYSGYKRDNRNRPRFEPGFGNWTLDFRTILLQKMADLNIPLRDEEVDEIFCQVQKRELTEGLPVTDRFRNVLRSFYSTDPLFMADMYDPILNPDGMIDRRSSDDAAAIDRVLAMIDAGQIVPYWASEREQ
ncbi:phosphoadenosine phosphosulfate reductase domain-containing protein [Paenibacillus gansuensis]|uniref:Phosphoadenosine phosphosulfate reductase family protein n=1 Tax=Paenibacillus gansuensis TaxID=306542 RepID=A0ABW5PI01_9BACL